MNGYELSTNIQQFTESKTLPKPFIVSHTTAAHLDAKESLEKYGIDSSISKPTTSKELETIFRNALLRKNEL